jgi:uncharacterized glyoxalase superfamily protein PhnB
MTTVPPIPPGFHSLTPSLVVDSSLEAIAFYKKAFNAQEIHVMQWPNSDRVMHAQLMIGDSPLMMGDAMPEYGYLSPKGLGGTGSTVHLYVEDADAVFQQAVDAGATVTMPITDTFWGDRYGTVTDPFGHRWSIATRKQNITPEEMMKAALESMAVS